MKECTETDKPLVSIVMATYNPRMDWFREQLISLNDQSYENMELLVLDDFSTEVPFSTIKECVQDNITQIPFEVSQNEKNVGSTKTFEKLTMLARGEYIAYCDQDDVWNSDKITTLFNYFTNDKISLAYSDVQIIDESGNIKADGITDIRKRHILHEGQSLTEKLIVQNFVIGCTMLIKSSIAKDSIPFISEMVHDHYLALMASLTGTLVLCRKSLVLYRIHNDNQTNTLSRVFSKEDYYNFKIKKFLQRLEMLDRKNIKKSVPEFNSIKNWADARDSYYKQGSNAGTIWKYRHFDKKLSIFELVMLKMPEFVFKSALNKIKKGNMK